MRDKSKIVGVILFTAAIFVACNNNLGKAPGAPDTTSGKPLSKNALSTESSIGYDVIKLHVLQSCKGCHSGSTPPLLDSLSALRAEKGRVEKVIAAGSMPPPSSGKLTACQPSL